MSSKKEGPRKYLNKTPAKHRDIFRDTPFAKKYGEGEDRTHGLLAGKHEKLQAPARVRTHDLLTGKAISEVHFTPRSEIKWSFGKICKKTLHRS